jgi:hypothetical protein
VNGDLRERLHRLADQPAPPQRLDIAQARRSGRRTRRRRRAGAVGGCVATVAALAAAAVLPWTSTEPVRPALRPLPSGPLPAPDASFGWLPLGERLKTVVVDRQNGVQSFELHTSQVTLTTYPYGPEPGLPYFGGGIQATRQSAPSVDGHPAYWLARPGQSNIIHLRWRYGRAGWADLQLNGDAATLDTRAVYRIADSVTVGRTAPVRSPVRINGLPASLVPVRMGLGEAEADFDFQVAAAPSATAKEQQANWLSVTTRTDSPGVRRERGSAPNTTIDGHPAWDSRAERVHSEHGERVVVYGDHGRIIEVNAGPGALKVLAPTGGVAGLVKRITFLPRAGWTTTPFG